MAHDHVIIGSGINGLVAAAMLAKKGASVLLLEREARLGGCMTSSEATLPGFTHDVMAATFVLFLTGPAHAALGRDLARHGLEFCHTPHPTAVLRPDGSSAVLTMDRAANIAAFNALAAGDGERHAADVGSIEANAPLLFGLLGGQLWSFATAKLLAREAWRRGLRNLAAYFGEALKPARGWLEMGYASPQVQALYAPWTLHCGLSPEDTYSAEMGKVVAFALEAAGAPIVKGGAGRAAEAFRALIEEQGGTVRTNADVERILVRDGRAAGEPDNDDDNQRRALQRQPARPVRDRGQQEARNHRREISVKHLVNVPVAGDEGGRHLHIAQIHRQPDQDDDRGIGRPQKKEGTEAVAEQSGAAVIRGQSRDWTHWRILNRQKRHVADSSQCGARY